MLAINVAGAQQPVTKDGPGGPPPGGMRGGDPNRMREMMSVKPLLNGITLTADQQKSVDAVDAKYAPQLDSMFASMRAAMQGGGPPDREAMRANREKMNGIQEAEAAEVRKLLTAEQQATFDRNVEERKSMMQRRRPGGPPGAA